MGAADKQGGNKDVNQMGSQLHPASFWGDFLGAVEIDLELRTCTHHPCRGGPTCLLVGRQLNSED